MNVRIWLILDWGENVSLYKRQKYRYFFLSFALALLTLSGLFALMMQALRPSASAPYVREPALDGQTTAYLPAADDSLTCLFIGADNAGENASTFILVRFDPANGKVPVVVFPPQTAVNNNGKIEPLAEVYRYGGAVYTREALAAALGVGIDRYARVQKDAFIAAANLVGTVEFELSDGVTLDRADMRMTLNPGKQLLDGSQAAEIIGHEGYAGGERERCLVTANVTAAIINQRMDICLSTVVDSVFEKIVNTITTDITSPDYYNRKPAAEYLARMKSDPAYVIEAAGSYDKSGKLFTLSDTFLARLARDFA